MISEQWCRHSDRLIEEQPLILCVDDNDDSRQLSTLILESLGYASISASDGLTALELIERYQPTLILLDISMPGMDGVEVVRRLKQNSQTAATIAVAVTAMAMKGDRERLLAAGFDAYISKPYTIEELESVVHYYLPAASRV